MPVVGVIGAGPAGMMAALQAARRGARVLLFDRNGTVGRKLLVTGNGRCNLTNASVAAGSYAIVLMDCPMPALDGFGSTARILEMEAGGRRMPIIAMTASVLRSDSERCTAAGMDDFLGKPLDPEQMQEVLARWLNGS